MDVRKLEHFVAVVDEGGFTRAAERMRIVQSGMSASIRSLERDLDAPLFDRTTQRVTLTEAGRALLPEARRILTSVRAARQAVDEVRGALRGTLRLGLIHGLPADLVTRPIAAFHQAHPQVRLELHGPGAGGTTGNSAALRAGHLDLAYILAMEPAVGVHAHDIAEQDVIVALAPEHRLAGQEEVELAQLAEEDFIEFPSGWAVRELTDRAFAEAGLERHLMVEMNDLFTVIDFVGHGLGVACVPAWAATRAPNLAYARIRGHRLRYRVSLAVPADVPTVPVARAFLRHALPTFPEFSASA